MNFITLKTADYLLVSLILALTLLNPAQADEPLTDKQLTDDHAQKIFELAMEERDSGKVYDAMRSLNTY